MKPSENHVSDGQPADSGQHDIYDYRLVLPK